MTARIELRTSPHVVKGASVETIMLHVVLALLPIAAFSVWQYGLSALSASIVTITIACLASERLFNRLSAQPSSLGDWSATITGLLLALALPPAFPLWMGAVAGFAAIALGKAMFGGIGYNVMNPALVGRAFVRPLSPVAITTWVPAFAPRRFVEFAPTTFTTPLMTPPDISAWAKAALDGFTGATPLARWKFDNVLATPHDFLSGAVTASAGETSAILILLCGLYLAIRRFMDWRIPVAILGSAALTALLFQSIDPARYPDPLFVLLSRRHDAGRGFHGHRYGDISGYTERRLDLWRLDRRDDGDDSLFRWSHRGSDVRHSAWQCPGAADRPGDATQDIRRSEGQSGEGEAGMSAASTEYPQALRNPVRQAPR